MRFDKPYASIPCTAITDTAGANSSTPANLALAVTAKHTQNTDTGTTSATFQLESGSSGAKIKNSAGTVALRNAADGADANATCATITASSEVVGPKAKITAEGGYAVLLTNNTGHTSVKGEIVIASASVDNGVDQAGASSVVPIGVIYNAGVAASSAVWVVVSGIAQVLIKDSTAVTRGQWIGCSDTAGRGYADADPIGAGAHNREVGHAIESKGSGTDVLCYVVLHQN